MQPRNLLTLFPFLFASVFLPAQPANAQATYTTLATFTCFYGECQPGLPISGLVEVSPGTFFGSLTNGQLYTFTSAGAVQALAALPGADYYEASTPIQASNGYLYIPSGINDAGTVFQYDLQGTPLAITVPVYVGASPLIEATNLTLYGTAVPANEASPIYSLSLSGASQVVATVPESLNSVQVLLEAANGKIYGLTGSFVGGGTSSFFELGAGGTVNVLSTFGGQNGQLIQASDGNFYGCGGDSLYRLTPAGVFTTIYTFTGGLDGGSVYGCGIEASDGKLYGTTFTGGANGYGTIFRSTLSGEVTPVYAFTGDNNGQQSSQYYPELIQGSDGKLYGATTGPYIFSPGQFVGATLFSLDLGLPKPQPKIHAANPLRAKAGSTVLLIGNNLLGATAVSFNGALAAFTVNAARYIQATVPEGATTGPITITTPNGTVTSSFHFRVE